ncbi:MAG: hypothetical protein PXZ08_07715 [Actinomycetota bacterium]|nr:hypothetical protein [Actinomycetota bacterium]
MRTRPECNATTMVLRAELSESTVPCIVTALDWSCTFARLPAAEALDALPRMLSEMAAAITDLVSNGL